MPTEARISAHLRARSSTSAGVAEPPKIGHYALVVRRSQRYDDAFAAVKALVDARDPVGLLAQGAPENEYEPEVGDLVRLVLEREPPTGSTVNDIWCRWFGDEHTLGPTADDLASQLANLQKRFRDTDP